MGNMRVGPGFVPPQRQKLTESTVNPVRGGEAKAPAMEKQHSKISGKLLADAAKKLIKYNKANKRGFKFDMGNLPTSRLSKIDAFTVKQSSKMDKAFHKPIINPPLLGQNK